MSFATQNLQRGSCGNLRVTFGQFTAGSQDAAGSITVEGSQVWGCLVSRQDASGTFSTQPCDYSVSGSNPVTVTVYNLGPVTTGRFIIFHL